MRMRRYVFNHMGGELNSTYDLITTGMHDMTEREVRAYTMLANLMDSLPLTDAQCVEIAGLEFEVKPMVQR